MRFGSWSKYVLILLLFVLVVGNSGIWYMPNIGQQFAIAANPYQNVFANAPLAQYLLQNYLEPIIFKLLGGSSFEGYLIYTFIVSIAFFVTFFLWFLKYYKDSYNPIYLSFSILIFPCFMIPFYWVGMDGMTLLLMLLIMVNYNNRIAILFAILLGLQHSAQGIVAFGVLFLTMLLSLLMSHPYVFRKYVIKTLYIIVAIVCGKIILYLWFKHLGMNIVGNRVTYLEHVYYLALNNWLRLWPIILFSLLGVGWVLVLKNIKNTYPLLIAIFIIMLGLSVIADQTRCGVILMFPSLFYWVFSNKNIMSTITSKFAMITLVIYLIVPVTFVWGSVHFSLLRSDYNIVLSKNVSISSINWLLPFEKPKPFFNSREYKGASLPTIIGTKSENAMQSQSGADNSGFLTYGPYAHIGEGHYNFVLSYKGSLNGSTKQGAWDVVDNEKVVSSGSILGTSGNEGSIKGSFVLDDGPHNIQIRSYYNGDGKLVINNLTITKV